MHQQDSSDPTGVREVEPTTSRKALIKARESKATAAVALAASGANWTEIAQTLGYPTPRAARIATEKALAKRLDETDKKVLRQLAATRLDSLLLSVWQKAHDPNSPEQMQAVQRAREIVGDHRRLFGLDAPAEVVISSPTEAQMAALVAEITAKTIPDVEEMDVLDAEWTEEPAAIETGGADAVPTGP